METKKEKNNQSRRKVSRKKQGIARYKWLKVVWLKIDEQDERIAAIEEFLGGRESMKKVLEGMREKEE